MAVLLDLTHTSHTQARTGVQRVARSLLAALGGRARPICHDPYRRAWRPLEAWELANLASTDTALKRGARWPLSARLRGRLRRLTAGTDDGGVVGIQAEDGLIPAEQDGDGLVVPEIFSPEVAAAFAPLFAQVRGPRVAIFHDAIALRMPELTPVKTVARFPAYLRELLAFDGIAANSEDSRRSLVEIWQKQGLASHPPVVAIPLGVDLPAPGATGQNDAPALPTLLSVGSIEGRKNHVALLEACERLWAQGLHFELRLIGLPQPQTGGAALEKIAALQKAGRPLRYDGPVDDATLVAAYRQCAFTVYPSRLEGFGLPVLESVALGRPCVCSGAGALGEAAQGGGCLALASVDAASVAGAIERLLTDRPALERLAAEARGRRFKTWSDYARELSDWMAGLPRR